MKTSKPCWRFFRLNLAWLFFSTKAEKIYWDLPETELLIFGKETKGLPDDLREQYADHFYKIPMFHPKVRSLNLANSVSIVLYHQLELAHRAAKLEKPC